MGWMLSGEFEAGGREGEEPKKEAGLSSAVEVDSSARKD